MTNVLLLSAGRRVELFLAFRKEIATRNMRVKMLAADCRPQLSAACQIADFSLQSPKADASGYVDFLLEACKRHEIGLVIPTIDTELPLLAAIRDKFAEQGISIVISDTSLIKKCRDKRLTAELFENIGFTAPNIYEKDKIIFPCFAKPYDGSSSNGAAALHDQKMLAEAMLRDEKLIFMEFIDSSHTEYTVDAYYSRQGELKCLVPRQRIEVRGGEVSKAVTRRSFLYEQLLPKLRRLKWARGCLTFQFFANEQTGRIIGIEINPRFGGGFPLSWNAGANYPGWLLDEYLLNKKIPFFADWEADLLMLRYDANILVRNAACL